MFVCSADARSVGQVSMMRQQKMAMELQELDAAGREALTKRVEEMQVKHAVALQTLSTPEERAAYVKGIPEEVFCLGCS